MLFPRGRLRRAVLHEVRPYSGGRLRRTSRTLSRAFAADIADVIADVIAGIFADIIEDIIALLLLTTMIWEQLLVFH